MPVRSNARFVSKHLKSYQCVVRRMMYHYLGMLLPLSTPTVLFGMLCRTSHPFRVGTVDRLGMKSVIADF